MTIGGLAVQVVYTLNNSKKRNNFFFLLIKNSREASVQLDFDSTLIQIYDDDIKNVKSIKCMYQTIM